MTHNCYNLLKPCLFTYSFTAPTLKIWEGHASSWVTLLLNSTNNRKRRATWAYYPPQCSIAVFGHLEKLRLWVLLQHFEAKWEAFLPGWVQARHPSVREEESTTTQVVLFGCSLEILFMSRAHWTSNLCISSSVRGSICVGVQQEC